MYVKEIATLTDFMCGASRSTDEICKFLALSIFQSLNPKSIFVGEVDSSGALIHVSSFGFDQDEILRWAKLSLALDIPITEAVLKNKCVIVNSPTEFLDKYPVASKLGVEDFDWKREDVNDFLKNYQVINIETLKDTIRFWYKID